VNNQQIYDNGFLNGGTAIAIVGLFFTFAINEMNGRINAGYFIFGFVIVIKLFMWIFGYTGDKK